VSAYLVFPNAVLHDIATARPRTLDELAAIKGIGPVKVARYGEDVLRLVAEGGWKMDKGEGMEEKG